jgi:hypothetical protein
MSSPRGEPRGVAERLSRDPDGRDGHPRSLAAKIGIDLQALINQAPHKPAVVITDIRTHWAAPWILPVAQTGVMDVFANHTFQPNSTVRRSDVAQIVSQLLNLVASRRPDEVSRWRAARPRLSDVPAGYVSSWRSRPWRPKP